jgi:hypothetical protein
MGSSGIDPSLDGDGVRHIHGHVVGGITQLGSQGLATLVQHVADHHTRTRLHQSASECLTQSAGTACDQNAPIGETDLRL